MQRKLLGALFHSEKLEGFILGGGTALAEFYLGHRLSDDLDIFTNDARLVRSVGASIPGILRESLTDIEVSLLGSHALQWRYLVQRPSSDEVTQLEIANAEPAYRQAPQNVSGIRVAGFDDLLIGKLVALSDRTDSKDIVDLWIACRHAGADLAELEARLAERDPRFVISPDRLARALTRATEAASDLVMPRMLIPVDLQRLREFLVTQAKEAVRRLERG